MKKILPFILLFLIACVEKKEQVKPESKEKLKVISVNYPLHYFAERIGGELIDARYPVPQDVDPAYWEPKADDITIYQDADLILLNGAGYAKWVEKVSLPPSKMINTSLPFKESYIELAGGQTHSHGPEGEHEHKGFAFTTWLNFNYAIVHAEEVYKSLTNLLPESEEKLNSNFQELKTELELINQQLVEVSQKFAGKTLFVSHPVYQYLSDGYGLNIKSFHWEPDQMPDELMWEELERELTSSKADIMLWEDKPLQKVNERLNTLGIKPVVFNPCGNKPGDGDFIIVMKANIQALNSAL